MKKSLSIVGIALVGLIGLFLCLGLVAPKEMTVTSTRIVAADQQQVFDHLRFMSRFPSWSPWLVQDPAQKYAVSGTDGQVGATYSWEGVSEESVGHQTVTAMKGNTDLSIACTIEKPFQSEPRFRYALKQVPEGTEVVQTFTTRLDFPTNAIAVLMGLEGYIREVNQLGLERLKQVVETGKAVAAK